MEAALGNITLIESYIGIKIIKITQIVVGWETAHWEI